MEPQITRIISVGANSTLRVPVGRPKFFLTAKRVKSNAQMMQFTFGFQKLEKYVKANPKAYFDFDNLTEEETGLLEKCGFVEWERWVEEED